MGNLIFKIVRYQIAKRYQLNISIKKKTPLGRFVRAKYFIPSYNNFSDVERSIGSVNGSW